MLEMINLEVNSETGKTDEWLLYLLRRTRMSWHIGKFNLSSMRLQILRPTRSSARVDDTTKPTFQHLIIPLQFITRSNMMNSTD